LNFWGF